VECTFFKTNFSTVSNSQFISMFLLIAFTIFISFFKSYCLLPSSLFVCYCVSMLLWLMSGCGRWGGRGISLKSQLWH
jgi:hypothetical protein